MIYELAACPSGVVMCFWCEVAICDDHRMRTAVEALTCDGIGDWIAADLFTISFDLYGVFFHTELCDEVDTTITTPAKHLNAIISCVIGQLHNFQTLLHS